MANRIPYFAYGSNMDRAQMRVRCSTARCVGRFSLKDHTLCFPRRSITAWPGSGVASITSKEGSIVEGVVYEITPSQWNHLWDIEGVPDSYEIKGVGVKSFETNRVRKVKVLVAVPEEQNASFDPDPDYLDAIERGAKANKLSAPYRSYLKELRTKAKTRRQLGNVITQTVQLVGGGNTSSKAVCHDCKREFLNSKCPDHPKARHSMEVTSPMGMLAVQWRVGPLHFYLAEPLRSPGTDPQKPPIKESDVLAFLCRESINASVDGFVARYRELSKDDLISVPEDETIREKLVLPLLEAKTNYMLGNYFAVITLCGMVCEVLSVIRYEMSPLQKNNNPLTEEEQRKMFGSTVDNLTQDRRLQLLHVIGQLDDQTYADFDDVRNTRNNYVHLGTNPVNGRSSDAKRLYVLTVKLIKTVFGIKPKGEEFTMDFALIEYLLKRQKKAAP